MKVQVTRNIALKGVIYQDKSRLRFCAVPLGEGVEYSEYFSITFLRQFRRSYCLTASYNQCVSFQATVQKNADIDFCNL